MDNSVKSDDFLLPHLETFAKSAELNSFTKTAKALFMTQAAISQRIQSLEKALGTSLFHRQGGRVLLTEAGQKLYDFAQRILDLHRQARQEVTHQTTPISGDLFLAASSIPGEHLLPGLLAVFGRKFPHVHVRATVGDSKQVIAQVERGEVSLGLLGRKIDHPHLEFLYLASDHIALVVPRGHALAKRKKLNLEQLTVHPLILREAGSGLRHCFEKALEPSGKTLADFRIALELGSNEAIKEAVLCGIGVAVLSDLAVRKELREGQLHALNVTDLKGERDLYVAKDTRRVLPLPARIFLDFIQTQPLPGREK